MIKFWTIVYIVQTGFFDEWLLPVRERGQWTDSKKFSMRGIRGIGLPLPDLGEYLQYKKIWGKKFKM